MLHNPMRSIFFSIIMMLGLASSTYATPTTVTETFDSTASTAAHGWVGSNNVGTGNSFGFSNTGTVSGTPGEAGGVFARNSLFSYFADTALGGSLSRTETLLLSGNLRLSNDDFDETLFSEYFNTANLPSSLSGPFMGLVLLEPTVGATAFRAFARIQTDAGALTESTVVLLTQGTTHTFNLTWAGNTDGSGTLSGTIGGTAVSLAQGANGDWFNAFGIGSGFAPQGTANSALRTGPSFFDTLSYSSIQPVPEPSSYLMMICGLGLLGISRVTRSRRRD